VSFSPVKSSVSKHNGKCVRVHTALLLRVAAAGVAVKLLPEAIVDLAVPDVDGLLEGHDASVLGQTALVAEAGQGRGSGREEGDDGSGGDHFCVAIGGER
jgi:hypothetical protein